MAEKAGRYDDMVADLRKVISIEPDHADALNYLGYSFADKGVNLDEALGLINRALALRPDSAYFIDSLAWVYFRLGRTREALAEIKRAVAITNNDPVLYEHMGDIEKALGNREEALSAWRSAIKYDDEENSVTSRVQGKIDALEKPKQ